jgi:hypothetical protein
VGGNCWCVSCAELYFLCNIQNHNYINDTAPLTQLNVRVYVYTHLCVCTVTYQKQCAWFTIVHLHHVPVLVIIVMSDSIQSVYQCDVWQHTVCLSLWCLTAYSQQMCQLKTCIQTVCPQSMIVDQVCVTENRLWAIFKIKFDFVNFSVYTA